MALQLIRIEVGPWPMNCYILVCSETKTCVIFDPGADPEKILRQTHDNDVSAIVVTHGHADHIGALEQVQQATYAPIMISPIDASHFKIPYDTPIDDRDSILVGTQYIYPTFRTHNWQKRGISISLQG